MWTTSPSRSTISHNSEFILARETMDGRAPVSGGWAASKTIVPISPPDMNTMTLSTSPPDFDECSSPPIAPTNRTASSSRSPVHTSTGTAVNVTSAASSGANVAVNGSTQIHEAVDASNTPEISTSALPQTSGGDKNPTISEKGQLAVAGTTTNGQQNGGPGTNASGLYRKSGRENAASGQSAVSGDGAVQMNPQPGAKGGKMKWFEIMPVVLQNFIDRDQEQIRQLALPRCRECERSGKIQKADAKCSEKGCALAGQPLCSSCWENRHSSDEERIHQKVNPSNCPQCQLKHSAFWCSECDLSFCRECFDQIHSVPRVKGHRKLAMEDSPGSYIAKANWSMNFQSAIMQMIAMRKQKLGVSSQKNNAAGYSVGEKRKRDVEVITIDDSDDDEGKADNIAVEITPSLGNGVYRFGGHNVSSSIQQGQATAGRKEVVSQVQAIMQTNPASMNFQPPVSQVPTMSIPVPEPIPFPQDLSGTVSSTISTPSVAFEPPVSSVQISALYNALTQPNTSSNVNTTTSVGFSQWNSSLPQSGATSMDTVTSSGSTTYTSIGMNNGAMGTYSAPMDVSSGMWDTNSAVSTDLANRSSSFISLASSVFAENPLVDSLLDRYNEANQRVLHLELQSEQLGKQITVATYKGLYAASPFMTKLNELKPLLEAAKVQRDKLLIIMVIQSNDIMGAVRRLRLSELFDVPQVPIVSHRKVLQLSIQINKQKKATMELNRQMSMTLNEPQVGNASSLTTRIRAISLNIQTLEENIKKLKKDRESEIVRIIQFSDKIREALKQEFHRNVEMQRQQQRQAQSFR